MTSSTNLKQLHEIDDQQWLSETINLLKEKRFNELDLENLIEEMESLGISQRLQLLNRLTVLLEHLL